MKPRGFMLGMFIYQHYFLSLPLNLEFTDLAWMGRQQAIELYLSPYLQCGDHRHTPPCLVFTWEPGNPKSGLDACTANSLLNNSSLEPWHKDIFKHIFHGKYKFEIMRQKRGASDLTWHYLPSESQWWIPVCPPLSPQTSEEVLRVGL